MLCFDSLRDESGERFTSLFIDAVNAKMLKSHCFIIATHDFELAQKTSGQILELTRGKQKPLQERPWHRVVIHR